MALLLRLSAIFLPGTKEKEENRQGTPLVVMVIDNRRWRADVEWCTLQRGSAEAWYRDRLCVLTGRMFHEFTAGVVELVMVDVAEVLTFLSPYLPAYSIGLWPTGQKCQHRKSLIIFLPLLDARYFSLPHFPQEKHAFLNTYGLQHLKGCNKRAYCLCGIFTENFHP